MEFRSRRFPEEHLGLRAKLKADQACSCWTQFSLCSGGVMVSLSRIGAIFATTSVAIAGLSGPIWLAPQAIATSVGDAQVVAGEAFLTNDFVEVGSRANGSFGSNSAAPGGYHP